jgi:hypothetical protein
MYCLKIITACTLGFGFIAEEENIAYWQSLQEEWKAAGFQTSQEKTSIHAEDSVKFTERVLKAGSWQLGILKNGFMPEFISEPSSYKEQNNRSALNNPETVQKKIQEWVTQGHVTELAEQPYCCSPLSVAEKLDSDSGVVKKRVVLDMSRHVNKFLVKQHVQLDDLIISEPMRHRGEFAGVFDLENQYFHLF